MAVPTHSGRIGTGPELFAPELCATPDDFDAALEVCARDFTYRRGEIALDRFVLDEDFRATLDGVRCDLTEKAFYDVCDILAIPARFARAVTRELFTIMVDRLGRLHQQAVVVVVRGDVVVGVVDPAKWARRRGATRPHFEPVTNQELLNTVRKVRRDMRPKIVIGDSGMVVEVLESSASIEPRVGDVIRVGVSVTGSETGGPVPAARGYTLRLVCANGAVVPTDFGTVRFSTDWRVRHERRVEAFAKELAEFSVDIEQLRVAYEGVVAGELSDHSVWTLHRQVAYLYRRAEHPDSVADRVLGLSEDRRMQLTAAVRRRQRILRRANAGAPLLAVPSGIAAWDVYNTLTAAARDEENHQRRVALERLGGDLLQARTPADPSERN